jgi:hypothetical protein
MMAGADGCNEDRPLPDDGASDVAHYNERLAALGAPAWTDVEWLYSECYLYRYGWAPPAWLL